MGVDWYSCRECGETFPDCGEFYSCEGCCEIGWCSKECADKAGAQFGEEDGYNLVVSCKFCREEDAPDSALLEFAISKLKISREVLVKEYFKSLK